MGTEKMTEGRRLAAEKRKQEAEAARAEEQKREEEEAKRLLEPATIQEFEKLRTQIKTFSEEMQALSKKNPDAPVNKFKLKFLNDVLKKMTVLLGEAHRPFPDFETFDEADLPTTSDVVLMLSHYIQSMSGFVVEHAYQDEDNDEQWRWHTKANEDIAVKEE